jgi:hypothetical protein
MKITLSVDSLNAINTAKNWSLIPSYYREYYHKPAGEEHYRLLMHLSKVWDGVQMSDIGTHAGASAVALSTNPNNTVYSLDIQNIREINRPLNNVTFEVGNFKEQSSLFDNIVKSKFILLDIDHMYDNEIYFYNKLVSLGWRGVLMCDDLHVNPEMERFWSEIGHPKIEVTKYGHGSGTGLVIMDDTEFELL